MALRKLKNEDFLKIGLFSKKEAGLAIGSGTAHVHSSVLGKQDPLAILTQQYVDSGNYFTFPWQAADGSQRTVVASSRGRHDEVEKILHDLSLPKRREVSERLRVVLEELFSNAIYHSFKNITGNDKYDRSSNVELLREEKVVVRYTRKNEGIYISVEDTGGHLGFDVISQVFERCYSKPSQSQIDTKRQGAGLGLYMTFEMVTHLRIDVLKDRKTKISIWVPEKRNFDSDFFSFNYFAWGKPWE